MQLTHLSISKYKGIEIELPWERANVLFGPNDAGKTNVLEAIATVFGASEHARATARPERPHLTARLEFDEINSSDAEILAGLFQHRHVPPIFPVWRSDEMVAMGLRPDDGPASLRWTGSPKNRSFKLYGARNPEVELDLAKARAWLLEKLVGTLRRRADAPHVAAAATVMERVLHGTTLRYDRGTLDLICPQLDACDGSVLAAARRLKRAGWASDPIVGPAVRQLATPGARGESVLRLVDRRRLRPYDIVWAAGGATAEREVEQTLRTAMERWYESTIVAGATARELRRLLPGDHAVREVLPRYEEEARLARNTSAGDRWLRNYPYAVLEPATWVLELAARLEDRANAVAAPLVRERGHISVFVADIRKWIADDQRLEVRVSRPEIVLRPGKVPERNGEPAFGYYTDPRPMRDLGWGVRIWTGIALLEAALDMQPDREQIAFLEELRRLMEYQKRPNAHQLTPRLTREFGERRRLLIVDEPEQHLHPRAQVSLAAWLAASADERELLIATHALPFLNLPRQDAAYILVTRSHDGISRGLSIGDDVLSALEHSAEHSGLSGRAEVLQTLRAVCLVEGLHDELVIDHFFGRELARHRVLVVPTRGAKNVNAIIDAPWLSRLQLPLVVLFDDVSASTATGTKRPPGRDVAARAVWDLLNHWDEPQTTPRVASFDLPDIIRALPEPCVEQVVRARRGHFPGWDAVDAQFANETNAGYKSVFLSQSGLPKDTDLDALLREILEVCRDKPHASLRSALNDVIALTQG